MLLQDQTILSDKEKGIRGNCLITSYACFLDLKVDDCPQIQYLFSCKEPECFWDDVIELWLNRQGYERTNMGDQDPYISKGHSDYYFAWGMSPRGVHHQVIYKDGILFHDPHPSRAGLVEVMGFEILTKINHA